MNKLILLLTLYFFVQPPATKAQRKIRSGFIVTVQGDTLHGEIRSRNWHFTPIEIQFRKNPSEDFAFYDTSSIVYFRAGEDSYIKANVLRDLSPLDYASDVERLHSVSAPFVRQSLFLKCLISGNLFDLLELKDFERTNYYLREASGKIIYLSYRIDRNNSGNILRYFYFRETLRTINAKYNNDPGIEAAINTAEYDATSLSRIVTKLNQAPSANTENLKGNTTHQAQQKNACGLLNRNNPAHCFFSGYGKDG